MDFDVNRTARAVEFDISAWRRDRQMADLSRGIGYHLPPVPDHIEACVVYPEGLCAARVLFYVRKHPEIQVSTYLDVDGRIDNVSTPYFGVYPNAEGGVSRFLLDEERDMYPAVFKSIEKQLAERAPSL